MLGVARRDRRQRRAGGLAGRDAEMGKDRAGDGAGQVCMVDEEAAADYWASAAAPIRSSTIPQ